ncbi:MAG: FAD-dependent oxidoreductase [Candidatus Magasanikbacteria bacterium]|nr:FAD-dependent oxidoreductase [Candidatus Magasanikbacteria bacterium]
MNEFQSNLIEKKYLTEDVLQIRLDKPKNFDFQAGQFIQIIAPNGEKQVFRSYSISSTPEDDYLELCVKLYDTGIASKLFQISNPGDIISFRGPVGRFVVNTTDSDLYCIATGVGLAPIMGMIQDELENKKNKHNIHLIFGVRYEKDIFWADRLVELQKKYANFNYSITISRPEETWTGSRGRVTEHLPTDTSHLHAFLCGNADMVKTVREILTTRGTDTQNIHFEIF